MKGNAMNIEISNYHNGRAGYFHYNIRGGSTSAPVYVGVPAGGSPGFPRSTAGCRACPVL